MVRIDLTKGFFIEVDPMCYTLKKTKIRKNKKGEFEETETTHGYFGSLSHAIEKYLYLNHVDSDSSADFHEYVKMIEETTKAAVCAILAALNGREELVKPTDACWIADGDHFAGVCPVCKAWVNSEQQHCPGCGQALLWEVDNG